MYMQWRKYRQINEVSMWRAVILQAILDSITQSRRQENIQARKHAVKWLNAKNPTFIIACGFAQLEPDFVINKMRYALKHQEEWRRSCDVGKGEQFTNF